MIGVTVAIDIACFFMDMQPLKKLLVLLAAGAVIVFVGAGLLAARTRFREVRFYVLAWLGAALSAGIMTMRHWLGIDIPQDIQFDSMRIVMVFDAVMMGLAIADRFNQLRQSRQLALRSSLHQAERNLMLNNRLAELEEQYSLAVSAALSQGERADNAIHDLRQPLQALRLEVRNILSGEAESDESRARMDRTLAYLEDLVGSHLKAGDADDMNHHPGDYPDDEAASPPLDTPIVLRSIYEMFEADAAAKGLEFRFVETSRRADIEPLVLMRIVSNLVGYAIKYTADGAILLGVRRAADRVRIEVHDTGPGMTQDQFQEALARTARLDRDQASVEGNGLGLSIAADLAKANGCTLQLLPGRTGGASLALSCPAHIATA